MKHLKHILNALLLASAVFTATAQQPLSGTTVTSGTFQPGVANGCAGNATAGTTALNDGDGTCTWSLPAASGPAYTGPLRLSPTYPFSPTAANCTNLIVTAGAAIGGPAKVILPNNLGLSPCLYYFVQASFHNRYLQIDPNGTKFTSCANGGLDGSFDVNHGLVSFTYESTGVVALLWTSLSWVLIGGTSNMMEQCGQGGVMNTSGNKLVIDPSGVLKLMPYKGNGIVIGDPSGSNGPRLEIIPAGGWWSPPLTTPRTVLVYGAMNSADKVCAPGDCTQQGSVANGGIVNNGSGLVRLFVSTTAGLATGSVLNIYNLAPDAGAQAINNPWTITVPPTSACVSCLDLQGSNFSQTDQTNVAGAGGSFQYMKFNTTTCAGSGGTCPANDHCTNPLTGIEVLCAGADETLLGVAHFNGTIWDKVLSWYNPDPQVCVGKFTTDRNTSNGVTTFAEINVEDRCSFLALGPPASLAGTGTAVTWSFAGAVSNNTTNDGVALGIGFDACASSLPVEQVSGPGGGTAGLLGTRGNAGVKLGLAEGLHFATLCGSAVTGGTPTYSAAYTSLKLSTTAGN